MREGEGERERVSEHGIFVVFKALAPIRFFFICCVFSKCYSRKYSAIFKFHYADVLIFYFQWMKEPFDL